MLGFWLAFLAMATPLRTGVWVVARDLRTPERTREVIHFVKEHGLQVVIAQVAVGGYAYYPSRILPRSPYHREFPDFDPLQMLLDSLQDQVEVHAWINTLLYWSLDSPPEDSQHVYYQHPDWFIRDDEGRSLREYRGEDFREQGIDGMFLDPTRPEVREFVASVYEEVASRYPVAYVHLDFVRYPGAGFGFTRDRERYLEETGIDPLLIDETARFTAPRWSTARTFDWIERWYRYHYSRWNELRAEAISQLVSLIHQKIQPYGVKLSGAVFPNPGSSWYRLGQDWVRWAREGALDLPVPMAYTRFPDRYARYLAYYRELQQEMPLYVGLGVWMPDAEHYVPVELREVQRSPLKTVIFFDFSNLAKNQALVRRLQRMGVFR